MLRQNNVARRNACCHKHLAVGGTQVDVGLTSGCIPRHDGIQVKSSLLKGLYHLITHLKTVLADARTHRGLDTLNPSTLAAHFLDYRTGNAAHSATPSRMGYSNDIRRLIGKHNRHTIGRIYPDDYTRQSRHEGIHALQRLFLLVNVIVHKMSVDNRHVAGMRLSRHDHSIQVHTQLHGKHDPGVEHPQRVITHIITQVHTRIGVAPIYLTACGTECRHTLYRPNKCQFLQFHCSLFWDKDTHNSDKLQ